MPKPSPPPAEDEYHFAAPLTPAAEAKMVAAYNRLGFVQVSGLIPPATVAAAQDAMWTAMETHPDNKQRVSRSADSWPAGVAAPQLSAAEITALWGAEYLRVGRLLSDGYTVEEGTPGRDNAPIVPPRSVMAINTFPARGDEDTGGGGGGGGGGAEECQWPAPSPHLDHCIPSDGYETFPRPVRLSTMTYLSGSTPAAHAGSTVVWPGSARRFERLAATDPARFK
eukprot:SAG22_NODE_3173_length_1880_cov_1.692308_4_plen_225_part_00